MSMIDRHTLDSLWPHSSVELREAMCSPDADAWLLKFGIDTKMKLAHFMAQISHETNGGTVLVENLNYRADALVSQWPSHFTRAQASEMAHNPQLIANQAYNGRMGNRLGTNDGWNYRGRGGTQTTGREGYGDLAKLTGLDLLEHPELVTAPGSFIQCSAADFMQCGCLPYATSTSSASVERVTRKLNGGTIGLSSRLAWFAKWARALGLEG